MAKLIMEQGILKPIGRSIVINKIKPAEMSLNTLARIANGGSLRILVHRSMGGVGDILMTTPSLRAIKAQWPNCHLTYATDFDYMGGGLKALLENNPYIDDLIANQVVGSREFDIMSDITSCCIARERKGVAGQIPNRIDIFAEHIGVSLEKTGYIPTYIVTDKEREWAKAKVKQEFPRPDPDRILIGIQPRASCYSRSYPLSKMIQLVNMLVQIPKFRVFVFDSKHGYGPQEKWNIPNVVNYSDYDIRATAALMEQMDVFIAPDSGLMHLAGALNLKQVAIFGGIDYKARTNYYPNTIAVAKTSFACYPCFYDASACNKRYNCIQSITPEEILDALYKVINMQPIEKWEPVIAKPDIHLETGTCIIREGGIGDLINCLPAFSGFKKQHPDEKVTLATATEHVDLMRLSGCFDEVIPLEKKWSYVKPHEETFDARDLFEKNNIPNGKGLYYETKPRVDAMADFLSTNVDTNYQFPIDEPNRQTVKRMLSDLQVDLSKDTMITLQFIASCRCRSWEMENYKKLIKLIANLGYKVICIEKQKCDFVKTKGFINLSNRLNINEFNAIISLSNAFIGVDSGGMHLAASNNIPFVTIFNAIPPEMRLSLYKNYRVITPKDLPCSPCWDRGCGKKMCMDQITPEIVVQNLQDLLKKE